jgi:GDP-L-fucose synthase
VTLFVTGGNGFLGKHVLKELDRVKIEYFAPSSSELDILDFKKLCNYLHATRPNTILHLAAMCGGLSKNSHLPADFLWTNTQMALNIYECARQTGTTKIYGIGSVCMYPANCPVPFHEDTIFSGANEPTSAGYSQAKRTLLMLNQTFKKQHHIKGAFLIPSNMYGIGDQFDDNKSHVIPAIIKKIDHAINQQLPVVELIGSGLAMREFVFVQDIASVIVKAIAMNLDTDLPINIGTGQSISIKDLAILIAQLMRYSGEIAFKDDGMDGQNIRQLSVLRAKEMLDGWEPQIDLKEGLKQTIAWYRQNQKSIV